MSEVIKAIDSENPIEVGGSLVFIFIVNISMLQLRYEKNHPAFLYGFIKFPHNCFCS